MAVSSYSERVKLGRMALILQLVLCTMQPRGECTSRWHTTTEVTLSATNASGLIGNACKLGNACEIGNACKVGNACKIGNACEIGNSCKIGAECLQARPAHLTRPYNYTRSSLTFSIHNTWYLLPERQGHQANGMVWSRTARPAYQTCSLDRAQEYTAFGLMLGQRCDAPSH